MTVLKRKIAICYDFDGTLSPDNMEEVSFIPAVGETPDSFWGKCNETAKKNNMDGTLTYLNMMIDMAKMKGLPMSREDLKKHGRDVRLFKGVVDWFDRVNAYGKERNIEIEHYIISSGVEEIIMGTKIASAFKHVFACSFAYNQGNAVKPATAVNYTNKTQHLFRINKGIFNYWQNNELNSYTPEKYIPFSRMIYIGDGETDVPCMKMVTSQGGHAIAVYNPDKPKARAVALDLYHHNRADFIARTDYSKGSEIEEIVQNLIDRIASEMKSESIKARIERMKDDADGENES